MTTDIRAQHSVWHLITAKPMPAIAVFRQSRKGTGLHCKYYQQCQSSPNLKERKQR